MTCLGSFDIIFLMIVPVLYNKEYEWSLSLDPGRETLSHWDFLSNKSGFVILEPLGSRLSLC